LGAGGRKKKSLKEKEKRKKAHEMS
jgi:hypothetical protein